MDWESYEGTVRFIYETLGKQAGLQILCSGASCFRIGKSGVRHQIDVLTSHTDGLHTYLTAVECKYWNEKVSKDSIMKLISIVEDCNFDKGVVVSKIGFTDDATKFAEVKNIGLIELREPTDADWEGRIKTININLNFMIPEVRINVHTPDEAARKFENVSTRISGDSEICDPDGHRTSIQEFVTRFINSIPQDTTEHSVPFDFPPGSRLLSASLGMDIPISKLVLTRTFTKIVRNILIDAENHVWMIMKQIFEKRQFVIGHDKSLREVAD